MHPLRNGSQATARPAAKPLTGTPGWFTESGDNNVPSYPGADWFNHVIAEFLNMMSGQGIVFDPNNDNHLQLAFKAINDIQNQHVVLKKINAKSNGVEPSASDQGLLINELLDQGYTVVLDAGDFFASNITPKNSTDIEGFGHRLTRINSVGEMPILNMNGDDDISIKNLELKGLGSNSQTIESGAVFDGSQNARRVEFEHVMFKDFSGYGALFSGGWGNCVKQSEFVGNKVGLGFKVSSQLPGWAGSGFLTLLSYFGGNDTAIEMEAPWCFTSINSVIEDNNVPVNQIASATPAVWINPWFESNQQSPKLSQSNIFIGGRKEGGEAPVTSFFGNMSLPVAPYDYECITDIDHGISIFRDENEQVFKADGQGVKAFKPHLSLGWDVLSVSGSTAKKFSCGRGANALAGGLTSETWGNDFNQWVDATKLVARRGFNSFDIEFMQEYGVKVQGQGTPSGGGIGFTRVVISTGQYQTGGAGSTQGGDRWMFNELGHFNPMVDGVFDIGTSASSRVRDLRIVNAPIVGSDYRIKDKPKSIPQCLIDFALTTEIQQYTLKGRNRTHYGIVITPEFLDGLAQVTSIDGCGAFCRDMFTDENGNPVLEYVGGTTAAAEPIYSDKGFYIEIPDNCNVLIGSAQYRVLDGKCVSDEILISDGKLYATKNFADEYENQLKVFESERVKKLSAPDEIRDFIVKQNEILHDENSGIEALTRAMNMRNNAMSLLESAETAKQEAMQLKFTYAPIAPSFVVTSGGVLLGDLWQVRYDEWQNILLEGLRRKHAN